MNHTHLFLTLKRQRHPSTCPLTVLAHVLFYGLALSTAIAMVWLVL